MQNLSRRRLLTSGLAVGATGMAFASLGARAGKGKGQGNPFGSRGADAGYGPLVPAVDQATGLTLLALPAGFEYFSFGWTGQIMDDGRPTPTDHDGMAVCAAHGHRIALVRNHELGRGESTQCFVAGGMYNPGEFGGTTNLIFDTQHGRFVECYTSLGGTIRNCAGGPTPWGSWVSCEETFHTWGNRGDGFNHGYVFDVPGFGTGDGRPIRAAGRFSHEAVAVDPLTGVMYQTEDTGSSGFYKYVQPGAGHANWRGKRGKDALLQDGGKLYAMMVDGEVRKDMTGGFDDGQTFSVYWQEVGDPEGISGSAFDSAPSAAVFSRGEGCWEDAGRIYFVSTDGGAAGLGQIYAYDPRQELLTMVYESRHRDDVDGPDNIAVSPRGGIVLCEDGGSNPKRMIGLTADGFTFPFAENRIDLGPGDIDAIDAVYPGTKANFWDDPERNYSGSEWAGATFYKDWLFANVQSPGVTFAIRGPWKNGAL